MRNLSWRLKGGKRATVGHGGARWGVAVGEGGEGREATVGASEMQMRCTLMWALPFGYPTLVYLVWPNQSPSGVPQPKEVQDVGLTVYGWKEANP